MTHAARYRRFQRLGGVVIADLLATARPKRAGSILVHVKPNGLAYPRLGLVVGKRLLPRAVDRNRVRRLFREWFRGNQQAFSGLDMLVRLIVKPGKIDSLHADLQKALLAK